MLERTRITRSEAVLAAGAPWFVAAAVSAGMGWLRMLHVEQMGVICGGSVGLSHYAACYAAIALLALGLARSCQLAWVPATTIIDKPKATSR